jgi:putrescine transport system substrate-binding protein
LVDIGRHGAESERRTASGQRAAIYPAVIADVTNAVRYPNASLPTTALVKPEIRNDRAVYPPEEIRRRLYVDLPAPVASERARTRAWTRLKSGR